MAYLPGFFNETWEKLSPENLGRARAKVEIFCTSSQDPILKSQLRSTAKSLFAAQDAIISMERFLSM